VLFLPRALTVETGGLDLDLPLNPLYGCVTFVFKHDEVVGQVQSSQYGVAVDLPSGLGVSRSASCIKDEVAWKEDQAVPWSKLGVDQTTPLIPKQLPGSHRGCSLGIRRRNNPLVLSRYMRPVF
jgi:hypothetical protein